MQKVYIFGGGAVGMALAVHLVNSGREVLLVRTSQAERAEAEIEVTVEDLGTLYRARIPCISICQLKKPRGWMVITAKAFANVEICKELLRASSNGRIVLLQNGLGVERPFLDAAFSEVFRAVLYVTGQRMSKDTVSFHAVKPSVIGSLNGRNDTLQALLAVLSTPQFRFEASESIEKAVWQKAVVNCAFNSLCPILDVDNGVFARDAESLALARNVVEECLMVAERAGVVLNEKAIMNQILQISLTSNHLISTLQDIRNGRRTEIDFLNLEVARIASSLDPQIPVPWTELLGRLIALKSRQ